MFFNWLLRKPLHQDYLATAFEIQLMHILHNQNWIKLDDFYNLYN